MADGWSGQVVAVGLNPAFQKTLRFDRLGVGEVNRARTMRPGVGGKAVNFAVAFNRLDPGGAAVGTFLGGETGRSVAAQLAERSVPLIAGWTQGATRVCTTVLCEASGQMTELIEPSAMILPEEAEALYGALAAAVSEARALALCGTYPPGIGADFYASLAGVRGDALVLLDGYRGVEQTLSTGAVDVFKVNREELLALTQASSPAEGAARCRERFGVRVVAVTDGPRPAALWDGATCYRYTLPSVPVVNPIGGGDTAAAGMVWRMLAGDAPADAFALGLAAASASCRHWEGAIFDPEEAFALRDRMVVERQ